MSLPTEENLAFTNEVGNTPIFTMFRFRGTVQAQLTEKPEQSAQKIVTSKDFTFLLVK